MRKIIHIALAVIVAISFSACNNDEPGIDTNPILKKKIKRVTVQTEGEPKSETITYTYDSKNNLISTDSDSGVRFDHKYSENKIVSQENNSDFNVEYILENNLIVTQIYHFSDGDVTFFRSYDKDKQLSTMAVDDMTQSFNWKDGVILSATQPPPYDDSKIAYKYTNYLNFVNIYLGLPDVFIDFEFCGARTKYLAKEIVSDSSNRISTETYDYEFDKDGCPSKIITITKEETKTPYSVETTKTTYTISY